MRATSDRHPDETLGERTVHLLLFALLIALAVLGLIYVLGHASELLVEVERRVLPGPLPAPRSHAPVPLP